MFHLPPPSFHPSSSTSILHLPPSTLHPPFSVLHPSLLPPPSPPASGGAAEEGSAPGVQRLCTALHPLEGAWPFSLSWQMYFTPPHPSVLVTITNQLKLKHRQARHPVAAGHKSCPDQSAAVSKSSSKDQPEDPGVKFPSYFMMRDCSS